MKSIMTLVLCAVVLVASLVGCGMSSGCEYGTTDDGLCNLCPEGTRPVTIWEKGGEGEMYHIDCVVDDAVDCDTTSGDTTDVSPDSSSNCTTDYECEDHDPCTTNFCENGTCGRRLIAQNLWTAACDDGNYCTVDKCNTLDAKLACNHEEWLPNCCILAAACDDDDARTVDKCEQYGDITEYRRCHHTPRDCNDYNVCTIDMLDQYQGCSHYDLDCDDGNACTTDTCDKDRGCVNELPSIYQEINAQNMCETWICDNPETGEMHLWLKGCDSAHECNPDTGECE